MLFRGYLPIMSGAAMADFLRARGIDRWGLKTFLLTQAARLKKHAMEMAAAAGRPYQYLGERTRKDDLARQINPLLDELLRPMEYYWVTAQALYSTDILFRKRSDLQELMPRLLQYSTLFRGQRRDELPRPEAGGPIQRGSDHRSRRE